MSKRKTTIAALDKRNAVTDGKAAQTWMKRAIAAYKRALRSGNVLDVLEGEEHRHEALEHGALVGDNGRTVAKVQHTIDVHRRKAWSRT
jgi:hypothetical protein